MVVVALLSVVLVRFVIVVTAILVVNCIVKVTSSVPFYFRYKLFEVKFEIKLVNLVMNNIIKLRFIWQEEK